LLSISALSSIVVSILATIMLSKSGCFVLIKLRFPKLALTPSMSLFM
jgi:hypothetical protein